MELNIRPPYDPNNEGLIPTHSHFTGAWLEAGLLGLIFWLVVAWRAGGLLLRGTDVYGAAGPVVAFLAILFLWDLLFSPFGGERRLQNGFLIWMVTYPLISSTGLPRAAKEEGQTEVAA